MSELPNHALLKEMKKAYALYKRGDVDAFDVAMGRIVTQFVGNTGRFVRRLEDGFDEVIEGKPKGGGCDG